MYLMDCCLLPNPHPINTNPLIFHRLNSFLYHTKIINMKIFNVFIWIASLLKIFVLATKKLTDQHLLTWEELMQVQTQYTSGLCFESS